MKFIAPSDKQQTLSFQYPKHGEVQFMYQINNLNNKVMHWWKPGSSMYASSRSEVKSIFDKVCTKHPDAKYL